MIPIRDINPVERLPIVTLTLLFFFVAVFVYQKFIGADNYSLLLDWGFYPDNPLRQIPLATTTVTYIFLHGGWLHLLSNMLYLWIFADNVEDSMGHLPFVIFFCLCGIAAALLQAFMEPDTGRATIGASGAVSGVLGAYLLRYPRAEMSIVVPVFVIIDIVRLPAWVFIVAWFLLQLLLASNTISTASGIAFGAHVGGFIAGLVLAPLFWLGRLRSHPAGGA